VPTEPYIRCFVVLHALGTQRAHVAKRLAELQLLWQIQERLNHYLVAWRRAFVSWDAAWVIAAWLRAYIRIQVGIGRAQLPPTRRLPIGRHFESARGTVDPVSSEYRNDRMRWRGSYFEERHSHLEAIEVVVVVVEHSKIHIPVGRNQGPVPGFISNQLFGLEVAIAADAQVN